MTHSPPAFRLGPWQVDPRELTLSQGRQRNSLQARSMALLVELHHHLGTVVSKDDLAAAVWGAEGASDELIARHISMIRQALGDNPRNARFLETVPRRGYRLIQPLAPRRASRIVLAATIVITLLATAWWLWQGSRPDRANAPSSSASPIVRTLAGAEPLLPPGPFRADVSSSPITAELAFIEGGNIDLAGALVVYNTQSAETTRLAGGLNRFPKFSPDGRFIAMFRHEGSCQLLIVAVADAGVAHRSECAGQVSSPVAWVSADRLWYAVDRGASSTLKEWRLEQSTPTDLWTAPAGQKIRFPVASSQRKFALLRSQGADQLVELNANGKPTKDLYGDPQLLVRWLSAEPAGERLLMVKFDGIDRFGLFEVQLNTGTVRLISNRHSVQSAAYAGSGTGVVHNIANYRSHHQVYQWQADNAEPLAQPILADTAITQAIAAPMGDQLIYLKNVGSGTALYHLDLTRAASTLLRPAVSGQRLMFPHWSEDGTRILVATSHPFTVELLDATSGNQLRTYDLPLAPGPMTLVTKGNTLFVVSPNQGKLRVYKLDLDSGLITQVHETPAAWGQVSRDGKTLYLVDQQFRFRQTSLDNGSDTTFHVNVGSLTGWQVVNQTLLAACPGLPSQSAPLCEMNLRNGRAVAHPNLTFYPSHLSLSDDSKWLVLPRLAELQMDLMFSPWAAAEQIRERPRP